jgi:site-specific DNA-methyltransferase (adenine-specific)
MKWNGGGKSLVLRHRSVQKTLYPTEKPLSLWRELVSLFIPKDGVLLDPYMGSGTSLAVAKERGLTAVGVDVSEKACEVAATRLRNAERQGRMFG